MSPDKTSVLIVDDHRLFREGLKAILNRESRYEVTGEAGNAAEAVQLARKIKPDLVLMDMALPDRSGIELIQDLRRQFPSIRVLVVSMHSKVDYIVKAFQAGAAGYVVKESASDRLLQGMECVLRDEYFLDSSISYKVVKKLMQAPQKHAQVTDAGYATLTPREQEILVLLAEGRTTGAIADHLCISPKTVENHRSNIMSKLDLRSPVELVRYAAKLGLIDVDLWKE